jgi:hypothetical protein
MKGGENMKKLLMVVAIAALMLTAFPRSPVNAEPPGSEQEQEQGWQSDAPPGDEEEGYTNPSPSTGEEQSEPEGEVETPESQEQGSDEQGD